jgi:hypothetical protein
MGKMKHHPRYNVLSFRATDEELAEIRAAIGKRTRQNYLLEAVKEKITRDRQRVNEERVA